MTRLSYKHWDLPTPKKYKIIGNTAIYSLPMLVGAVMALPITETPKLWINFVLTIALVGAKTVTKFLTEIENIKDEDTD